MTARHEAPTLDGPIVNHEEALQYAAMRLHESNLARAYVQLSERLRSIEQAAGMPDYPVTTTIFYESIPVMFVGVTDYDKLTAHCLHLADKLARMEALLREPTLEECFAAGKGPEHVAGEFHEGGLLDTADERARFEAYMRGHCWDFGKYDSAIRAYDTGLVRMLYGVWRDRGAISSATLSKLEGGGNAT